MINAIAVPMFPPSDENDEVGGMITAEDLKGEDSEVGWALIEVWLVKVLVDVPEEPFVGGGVLEVVEGPGFTSEL